MGQEKTGNFYMFIIISLKPRHWIALGGSHACRWAILTAVFGPSRRQSTPAVGASTSRFQPFVEPGNRLLAVLGRYGVSHPFGYIHSQLVRRAGTAKSRLRRSKRQLRAIERAIGIELAVENQQRPAGE